MRCRFHIQADFVLPSSREGILEGRAWNKWLRDEVSLAGLHTAVWTVSVLPEQTY
jgi:hypothetical protein